MKKAKKMVFLSLILSLIMGSIPVQAQTFYTQSWMIKQEQTNWCWNATAQMMASTRTSDFRTQTEIATYTFGSPYNWGGTIDQIAAGATYAAKGVSSLQSHNYTYSGSSIQNIVSANWTIGCGAYTDGGSGHAFAIDGYDNSTGQVLLFDPWPSNSNCWITVFDFVYTGATSNHFKWKSSAW